MKPAPEPSPQTRNRPVHQVRFGNVKAAVWSNATEHGRMFTVTVCRSYLAKGENGADEWRDTDSFGRDDLLVLAKALDECHSWICAAKT